MDRRQFLSLLIGSGLACRPVGSVDPTGSTEASRLVEPVERAFRALRALALPDGRIPSSTYGVQREGHATTAILGLAASLHPECSGLPTSLDWLESRLALGPLGFAGPAADYPVYATSLGLAALLRGGRGERSGPALDWLLDQQLRLGWEGAAEEGGFGLGRPPGQAAPVPPYPGHVDLSMTRRAMQALALAAERGLRKDRIPAALAAGLRFARRCRAGDGGFVYSPGELALNKSALLPGREVARSAADHRGYGSATADGLLALRAAGVDSGDEDLLAARAWLLSHHRLDRNPGLEDAPIEAYGPAMRFYYRAAAAEALGGGSEPAGWGAALRQATLDEQGPDGLWRNERALQKEDDPLIATALALIALAFAA